MSKEKSRVVIIGLDGVTWKVLPLHSMPYLRSLQQAGASGRLLSTLPPITAPAWASFQTGVLPGKHGVYSFQQIDRMSNGQWKLRLVNASSMHTHSFWYYLQGQHVGIVNLPMTYPPAPVPGFLVTGFPTPSRRASFTWPKELQEELLQVVPDYDVPTPPQPPGFDHRRAHQYIAQLTHMVQTRGQAALYLMRRSSWDLFIVQFQETDFLQHALWHYLDSKHPYFSPQGAELAQEFFRQLDAQIAQIHQELSPDDVIWVISDHGFQRMRAAFYPNAWLQAQGWLQADPIIQSVRVGAQLLRRVGFKTWLQSSLAEKARRLLRSRETQHCAAYAVAEHVGCFELYLLTDGAKHRQDELKEALLQLKDPANGEAIVQRVLPAHEAFGNEPTPRAPDLLVCLRNGYAALPNINSPKLIEPWAPEKNFQVGIHDPEGIFIVHGPQIIPQQEGLQARLIDIAPTVLFLFRAPVPSHMDGHVITELFDPQWLAQRSPLPPFLNGKGENSPPLSGEELGERGEGDEEIRQRLKDLGYL